MEDLAWRIRISVLWIYMAVGMSAAMILYFMRPGVIDEMMTGKMGGMELNAVMSIVFALFWLIPLTMAFLTLILKRTINRYTNAILGLFFAVFYIFDISGHLSRGEEFGGHCLMGVVGIVVALIIFWHAWKWPKK